MTNFFINKYRKAIIVATIVILIVCAIPLFNIQVNSDLLTYLPEDLPAVVNKNKAEEIFGKSDPVIILFESDDVLNENTLNRISDLSKAFNREKDFDMVMSLFDAKAIKGEQGAMLVEPVVKRIPKSEKRRELLRQEIVVNDLVYNHIVSEDFKYTLIILNSVSDKDDADLMKLVMSTLDEFSGDERVLVNGEPYLRSEAKERISKDFKILLPIGLLIMCVFLWLSFREKRGLLLPTFVVLISIVISMALIPLFQWELSIIGILIPVMMIAIANDYGIHVIAKYQELNARYPDMSRSEIILQTINDLKKPVIITGITTIVGVSGLITHVLLPAKQLGIVASIGIAFALLASLTTIPAIMLLMKKGKPHASFIEGGKKGLMDKILSVLSSIVTKKPRQVIVVFIAFTIIVSFGYSKLRIASDFDGILSKKHPHNVSLNIINEHFGGTKNISLLFKGDIKSPDLLNRMLKYESEIEEIPGVGSANSIASMIKIMSRAINDPGDPFFDKIPDNRNALAQYLELYAMSGDPEDFEDFVDFDYQNALIQIQFHATNLSEANSIIEQTQNIVSNDKNFSIMGGMGQVENKLCNVIAIGQISSLAFAFIAILILLMLIFKSVRAGLLGSLPLLFAIVINFGLMGWLGIELDIITALLSSISIGLGVDYTIHIFWRIKLELKNGVAYNEAIMKALKTTGRGITINAFSVIIGFSVLFFSGFPVIRLFAYLIVISIVLCLIAALILIPAISYLLEPKFLKK